MISNILITNTPSKNIISPANVIGHIADNKITSPSFSVLIPSVRDVTIFLLIKHTPIIMNHR